MGNNIILEPEKAKNILKILYEMWCDQHHQKLTYFEAKEEDKKAKNA